MVIMLLPHITAKKQEAWDHKAPGNIIVEMHWPNNMPYDMNLWVQSLREVPVGFWNLDGTTFNLLRDALGGEDDATNENYEISYSRGIPPGEYVVNVHMYGPLPYGVTIPVNVVVSVKPKYGDVSQRLETTINLTRRDLTETTTVLVLNPRGETD